MNRDEYLEILRDYLKGHFMQSELDDILRDYEEFFINGKLEGKTDEELSTGLGSPKQVAMDLIGEIKNDLNSDDNKKSKYNAKQRSKVRKEATNLKNKFKDTFKDSLNGDRILEGKTSTLLVKLMVIILSMFLVFISFWVLFGYASAVLASVGMIIANVVVYGVGFSAFSINAGFGATILFGGLILTGLNLIGIGILKFIWQIGRRLYLSYKNWTKRKFMYAKASENHGVKMEREEAYPAGQSEENIQIGDDCPPEQTEENNQNEYNNQTGEANQTEEACPIGKTEDLVPNQDDKTDDNNERGRV